MRKPLEIKNFPGAGPLTPLQLNIFFQILNPSPLCEKLDPLLQNHCYRVGLHLNSIFLFNVDNFTSDQHLGQQAGPDDPLGSGPQILEVGLKSR